MMKEFVKQTFCENGVGSFARVASGFTTAAAIFCLCYHTIVNHRIPDAMAAGGLATFAVAPYTASKVSGAVAAFSQGNGNGPKQ